ncbi:hypothetical protein JR316_0011110 [Psilocybe cubensis]|uniref:Uncharacterized protein n=2 Tax=Psilocybe cubensis TaxID=181762 RepID=A0ACB8GPQ0_PSICU|nr:hypothetical protein JR316_0011110 [Psilocybe cubensis]KAH9477191.1 hypothetical protein JR316_0011110 [Psilocybe cubensis]
MQIISYEEILRIEAEVLAPTFPDLIHPTTFPEAASLASQRQQYDLEMAQLVEQTQKMVLLTENRLILAILALFNKINWTTLDPRLLSLAKAKITEGDQWLKARAEETLRDADSGSPEHILTQGMSIIANGQIHIRTVEDLIRECQDH